MAAITSKKRKLVNAEPPSYPQYPTSNPTFWPNSTLTTTSDSSFWPHLACYPTTPWSLSPPTQPRGLPPTLSSLIDLTVESRPTQSILPTANPEPKPPVAVRPLESPIVKESSKSNVCSASKSTVILPKPATAPIAQPTVVAPRSRKTALEQYEKQECQETRDRESLQSAKQLARQGAARSSSPVELSAICLCKKPEITPDETVRCASDACKTKLYHRDCVGLSNKVKYKDTSNWKCRDCRTKPPPPVEPPSIASPAPLFGPEPPLHEEQQRVVDAVANGYNVFYTGSAGTGKSTVLKSFVKVLEAQGKRVDIIAPSGIAALAIGGSTIYSYAGWYPDIFKEGLNKLGNKAWGKTVRKRLCKTDVLVIDEISMVEADMLTRLDYIMRTARHNWHPEGDDPEPQSDHDAKLCMGGAQLIVTGDFCQLPPVRPFQFCITCGGDDLTGREGERKRCPQCKQVYKDQDKWAFASNVWEAAEFSYFELRHVHRQSDVKFISILQKVRVGEQLTRQEKDLLLKKKDNMDAAVKLLPSKAEVNRKNQEGLMRLQGIPRIYHCVDKFAWRNKDEPALQDKGKPLYPNRPDGPLAALKDHRFEERVEFKVGMLVILLVNLDLTAQLANGSQGKVIGFEKWDPKKPLVEKPPVPEGRSKSGKRRGDFEHAAKTSQRSSDIAYEQSEAERIHEIYVWKENQCRDFMERAKDKVFPIVEFRNGVQKAIVPSCQMNELGSEKPYSILSRTNIPLAAAWAITIHKSQGMTLDLVSVDLYNSFEKEMVYVALSRARSLEGLEVLRLPRDERQAMNATVLQFLEDNLWSEGKKKILPWERKLPPDFSRATQG